MKNTLYKAQLKSSWSDNDGDIDSEYHNAFIRLYENGEVISRAGFDESLTIEEPKSYSLKGRYTISDDSIELELEHAPGIDESINWNGIEMKYWGELVSEKDFLASGKHQGKLTDDGFLVHGLNYKKVK